MSALKHKRKVRLPAQLPTRADAVPYVAPKPPKGIIETAADSLRELAEQYALIDFSQAERTILSQMVQQARIPREMFTGGRSSLDRAAAYGYGNGGTVTGRTVSHVVGDRVETRSERVLPGITGFQQAAQRARRQFGMRASISANPADIERLHYTEEITRQALPDRPERDLVAAYLGIEVRSNPAVPEGTVWVGDLHAEAITLSPSRGLLPDRPLRNRANAPMTFYDLEASFDPRWLEHRGAGARVFIHDSVVMDTPDHPERLREREEYLYLARQATDIREEENFRWPKAVRNDGRQCNEPHARFLAENARFSTKRNRR